MARISLRQLLDHAAEHGYGVPAFNINNMEQGLAILEAANLVAAQRRGREKLHFINPVPINAIAERWIGKFERPRLRALSDLKDDLEGEDHD